jgi:hypothetical protein
MFTMSGNPWGISTQPEATAIRQQLRGASGLLSQDRHGRDLFWPDTASVGCAAADEPSMVFTGDVFTDIMGGIETENSGIQWEWNGIYTLIYEFAMENGPFVVMIYRR